MHLLAENVVLRATKTPESWLGSYPSKSSSVTSTTETLSNAKISRDAKNETFEDKTRRVARVPFPDHLHLDMVELPNRLQSVANLHVRRKHGALLFTGFSVEPHENSIEPVTVVHLTETSSLVVSQLRDDAGEGLTTRLKKWRKVAEVRIKGGPYKEWSNARLEHGIVFVSSRGAPIWSGGRQNDMSQLALLGRRQGAVCEGGVQGPRRRGAVWDAIGVRDQGRRQQGIATVLC
ncbi:hypothetical protein RHGRI_020245 [Rhododendron griersonianum]|uniref:Uncharacterized protein n=1 Tax=Rhododendron griersonianum TaxID=479676 RepID=A0AAV6JGV5_9ERIC|nr:hypothetical protein RHGRI_020245 [Rhododendron griersonianum]